MISKYEEISIASEKIEALMHFLLNVAQGPQEAVGMLHQAIVKINALKEKPSTPEELGQELTACILLSRREMQ